MTAQYPTLEFVEDDMAAITFAYTNADGSAVNITGYTLVLQVSKPDGTVLEKTAAITSATGGLATFSFGATDLNFTGLRDAQLKITDGSGLTTRIRGFGLRIFAMLK